MNKKIAFVLPTTLGNSGGIKMVFLYAREINKLGYQCDVIYPLIPSNYKYYKFKNMKNVLKFFGTLFLNLINYNLKKFSEKYDNVKIVKVNTLKELKYLEYESYIATAWDTYYYIKESNAKKKYFVQSYETWSGPSELVEKTYNDSEFEYYTISSFLQKELYSKFNTKSICIQNPLDNILQDNMNKDYESNIYGVMYRTEKNKNFNLIEKFLIENVEYQEKFYCVGRNIPKKYKKLFAKCYDGNSSIELNKFYEDINIFIMPSNHEGFSLPIMEAISFNNMIISNTTGIILDFYDEIKYINIGTKDKKNKNYIKYEDLTKSIDILERMTLEEKKENISSNRKFYKKYMSNVNWAKNSAKIISSKCF